ncbi:MAG: DUF5591 domain-containing protein [Candidatus Altiarchaeota archaeon]|nr:DUF5591 domain-containing protein [Candidatus Altiarchaeota archaeon]
MPEKIFLLKFGRCKWSKCLFCGYGASEGRKPESENMKRYFDLFFDTLEPEIDHIKVFGSGSFFDEQQMPAEGRRYFIERCRQAGIRKLMVESRPEFITPGVLGEFSDMQLEVAIGLEVADDRILDKINKGFHLRDFERAVEVLRSKDVKPRTYLLVNLPFVDDVQESLDSSVKYTLKYSDSIVLINLLPHYMSRLMKMWVRGEWSFLSKDEFYDIVGKWMNDPRIGVDVETFRFVPKFPSELREKLSGVGEEYLTHPHFDVWQDYLVRWYEVPKGKEIILFLPCSHRKPYSESETHKKIIEKLNRLKVRDRIHEVMLSNAGVVPREFEDMYPFNAYDWDEGLETEEIKKRYIEVTAERIREYVKAHSYDGILCFLKYDSESYKALNKACHELDLEFRNLLRMEIYEKIKKQKKPLQGEEALSSLSEALKDEIGEI